MLLDQIPMTYHPSTRRKTFALKVMPLQVRVYYPQQAHFREVQQWVASQSLWIAQHWRAMQAKLPSQTTEILPSGLWWRGEQLSMAEWGAQLGLPVAFDSLPLAAQKKHLLAQVQENAQRILPSYLAKAEQSLGKASCSLKIRPYKSRWGSCDAKQRITLNSLLVMAPASVAEYVACHEVAHLFHLNHSRAFWQTVQKACSRAHITNAKAWLHKHGSELTFLLR